MLFILFSIVYANCNDRTKLFGKTNDNYYYFDPRTYTESSEYITPRQYRASLTVPCTGQWCIDNQWKCNFGDSSHCYNIEHIIPQANDIEEIKGCSTDVVGNMVMAYGGWNQALSNKYYGEKVAIYGSTMVKSAFYSILTACYTNTSFFSYPKVLCLNNTLWIYNIAGLIIIFIIIILVSYVVYKKHQEQENAEDEHYPL